MSWEIVIGMSRPPLVQQGHYRYDPNTLSQHGPARIFPYSGEDGVLRYILTALRHNLLQQGQLSQPWSLALHHLEQVLHTIDQTWGQITTFLSDLEIFQSGWFNFDLPPDEQFSAEYVQARRQMIETLLAARKAAQADGPNDAQRQRFQFYQALEEHDRLRPVVSRIMERDGGLSDREFARQRLAGPNPMVIRRLQSFDQSMLPTWNSQPYSLADGTSLDLAEAAAKQRLFVVDYPILQTLTPADLQPGRYVGSPIALFYRTEQGLEPVLIQLEPGQIGVPSDADAWMRAKLSVQTADVTHHELITHLGETHLAMEAFAIATPRQLPSTHPVYRLLHPHFRFLLAINTRGNEILLSEGAAIDRLMAPTRDASLSLINRAYRERSFQDYALPKDMQQRGLAARVLPDFPYRDDALLLWQAIARYVSTFLLRYYRDDQAVQHDPYLQAWAAELGAPLSSRPRSDFPTAPAWVPPSWIEQTGLQLDTLPDQPRVPNFPNAANPGALTSLQSLINIATQVIFTCGPQHAAVNFSQFDYTGYTPNAPLALYSPPDRAASLAEMLPSPTQDLGQIELTFALSGIQAGQLGSSELISFVDAGDRLALAQFQADLAEIEQKISSRNDQRLADYGVAYPYLLPSRIPNSINI